MHSRKFTTEEDGIMRDLEWKLKADAFDHIVAIADSRPGSVVSCSFILQLFREVSKKFDQVCDKVENES